MAGVPLIVNRHGAAAELPAKVALMLPDQADAAALAEAITALHRDVPRRLELSAAGRGYALGELAPHVVARRYRDVIERVYAMPRPAIITRRLVPEIEAGIDQANGVNAVFQSIGQGFRPWRLAGEPRLLIDMSELCRRDSRSGIQRVVREIGRRVLEISPRGHRGEAVRAHDGRLRHTYAMPLRILEHDPLTLQETPLDAGDGDILLCADVNPELTPEEYAELRRLRLAGMRIVLVVYDLLPMSHPELFPELISRLVTKWYTDMLGITDAVACISRAVADELATWLDEHGDVRKTPLPIGVFHLGADFVTEIDPVAAAPELGAQPARAEPRPTIVMVGTIEPRKAYPQVLAAFEHLWQQGEQIDLTIVGKQGWQMESFADRLRSAPELGNRLHWLEDCTDTALQQVYKTGSGLLMASCHEGFGLPIIEAARAGLPVMARDLPVFREVAGPHAHYFSGHDAETLAQALRDWMTAGFTPSSANIAVSSWDDSFRQLCAIIFDENCYRIWRP